MRDIGRYDVELVRKCVKKLLVSYGLNSESSHIFCDVLLMSDMCGIHTHGLSVLPAHIDRMKRGGYSLEKVPIIEKETTAFSLVNANNTIGCISAHYCMNLAMEKCLENGIHIVISKNCNTYAAAFYYTKLATDKGLIGITFCNSPSAMAAWGGKKKILGTNPLAIGIPAKDEGPILFDMATSIVAKSKINEARKMGINIPEGWALDCDGNSTTSPIEAINGFIMPMAGPKGYGLAMMFDILAGLLSGSAYLNDVGRFYSSDNSSMNVGQVFIAIDPTMIMSTDFYNKMDEYISTLHKSGEDVRYPGENKMRMLNDSLRYGVELSSDTVLNINSYLKNAGLVERL